MLMTSPEGALASHVRAILFGGVEVDEFAAQIRDHFDTVYAEGAEQGRVMCIALHLFWIGQRRHRIMLAHRLLAFLPCRLRRFRADRHRVAPHRGDCPRRMLDGEGLPDHAADGKTDVMHARDARHRPWHSDWSRCPRNHGPSCR